MSSRYGPSSRPNDQNPLFASSPYSHNHSSTQDRYLTPSNPYGSSGAYARTASVSPAGYRAATPNNKGQYAASVLEELESQNDAHVQGLSAKVKMLKDITTAIGEEVRSSTTLMDGMNDRFEATRRRLRGTMGAMLRMAQRTGVGWRAWLAFLAAVVVLFWWVWI